MFNRDFSPQRSRISSNEFEDHNSNVDFYPNSQNHTHLGQFDFQPPRPLIELKADLYSILNTAQFLQNRFEKGSVDTTFYIRRMRYFYQQILLMQKELHLLGATVFDLVEGLPLEGNFRSLIGAIANTMDYEFNSIAAQWQLDPFHLAKVATQVTSDFITLLDFLHLAEDMDLEFVSELLSQLIQSLQQIHAFHPFQEHLNQLLMELPNYFQECQSVSAPTVENIRAVYSQIEEIIASAFAQFKQYLHFPIKN